METVFKDEAIVLRKSPVGDFDLSITVYTRQVGKENIYIPKGQLTRTGLITATEPFNWFRGVFKYVKGKLYLQEIDTFKNLAIPISQDLRKFYTAFEINSLFNRYVIFPDERFFILLKKTLYYLTGGKNPEIIKLNFIVKLIYLSGIFPELGRCQKCGMRIDKRTFGYLSVEKAGCICTTCIEESGKMNGYFYVESLKSLKNINFQNLEKLKFTKKQVENLEKFLKDYLSHNL